MHGEALFNGTHFEEAIQSESVRNILARYSNIDDVFPEELREVALPYFIDWLIENVHLIEITAYSDDDAYTIFETMNDRGLSLSPADMLKGYLLANIADETRRLAANRVWKERVTGLAELGKDEDVDCLKAWLRSQYANSIRERKRDATPQDFDKIGTEFHRWVRENDTALGLKKAANFADFIDKEFAFYARHYERLRRAAETMTAGVETIFYNAKQKFTLQYPLLLAPLIHSDSDEAIRHKLQIVASFVDILITRRIWNQKAIDYSTMQYAMFLVMKDIRRKSPAEISTILLQRLAEEKETFESNDRFSLHGMNGRQIHNILARMTDYIETQSGMASRYADYIVRSGKNGYEVEHIWANHPERHEDEFEDARDFDEYRNRIGGLLLLPKSFNASYGDLPYDKKLEHYNTQNLLARSLHELAYSHNPGFLRFKDESHLSFRAHKQFKKTDLDDRHLLYRNIAEAIWNSNRLGV
jgi:hypothetical protein